ncbi:MAG: HIT domain-containing protein [Rickettsiales bacterium]|jgi:diadenosine tetraphosphate (Ap4A) HIT family hydrolase|nr:HIT domain-containing protein [Rickettsiales bacterium]
MAYDKENIFAKIIRGEAPATKVFENDDAVVIANLYPKARLHLLAMPKGEYRDFTDFEDRATGQEKLGLMSAIGEAIRSHGLANEGYRLVMNTGVNGGQSVPHFHVHILGKEKLDTFGL